MITSTIGCAHACDSPCAMHFAAPPHPRAEADRRTRACTTYQRECQGTPQPNPCLPAEHARAHLRDAHSPEECEIMTLRTVSKEATKQISQETSSVSSRLSKYRAVVRSSRCMAPRWIESTEAFAMELRRSRPPPPPQLANDGRQCHANTKLSMSATGPWAAPLDQCRRPALATERVSCYGQALVTCSHEMCACGDDCGWGVRPHLLGPTRSPTQGGGLQIQPQATREPVEWAAPRVVTEKQRGRATQCSRPRDPKSQAEPTAVTSHPGA